MIDRSFPTLDAFYSADVRRRHSRERDVGLLWRAGADTTFRAAWVQETGEVYLFRHGHTEDGGGTVHVLARCFELSELLSTFAGYGEVCGLPGSLAWFLSRVDDASAPAKAA